MISEVSVLQPGRAPSEDALETGYQVLIDALRRAGVHHYAGVNGGGIFQLARHLQRLDHVHQAGDRTPRLLTMSEYIAGFAPLGYYLASGRAMGCVTTTGAATKLAASGMSEAKLHDIPAVYLVALNPTSTIGHAPLQDVSDRGMSMLAQLRAEFGEACLLIDVPEKIEDVVEQAAALVRASKPAVIAFHPDALGKRVRSAAMRPARAAEPPMRGLVPLVRALPDLAHDRRVVLFVGSEAARYPNMPALTCALAERLRAPTVWSVNGANAVSRDNPYGYGYISFGGNDAALELWQSLDERDIVLALGLDPGEYTLVLERIPAGDVIVISDLPDAYGSEHGEFAHRVAGRYHRVRAPLDRATAYMVQNLDPQAFASQPDRRAPASLNTEPMNRRVRPGCVDLVAFYQELDRLWRPGSIGFDDVCMAYKDRPYITQRPNPNIRFYTMYNGSAMGHAFGLGVGAKLADPRLHTFVFAGDGCWRLFGSALAEAARMDLRVFILDNGTYAIVEQGLRAALPDLEASRCHVAIEPIDFAAAAQAHGWHAFTVEPDLSNLADVMEACYVNRGRSILINVPVDSGQVLGPNPRRP